MKEKIKLDNDSELIISKVVNITFDRQGNKIKEFKEFRASEPISLGSKKNPLNEDLIAFEWRDTTPIKKRNNIFRDIF